MEARVQTDDFSLAHEYQQMRDRGGAAIGAVAAFVGLVRDRNAGRGVGNLTLEHYPEMTRKSMLRIISDATARWDVLDVVVIHRVGELAPEDQIVLVLVASAHRPEAFAAAEFIMDYLKTDAVFWKKEQQQPAGQNDPNDLQADSPAAHWVQSRSDDHSRRARWETSAEANEENQPKGNKGRTGKGRKATKATKEE